VNGHATPVLVICCAANFIKNDLQQGCGLINPTTPGTGQRIPNAAMFEMRMMIKLGDRNPDAPQ